MYGSNIALPAKPYYYCKCESVIVHLAKRYAKISSVRWYDSCVGRQLRGWRVIYATLSP